MKDTSGSAFPTTHNGSTLPNMTGLTKREYFAAHAPVEPQPWFRPVMLRLKPDATVWVGESGNKYTSYYAAKQAEGEEHVTLFNAKEIEAWEIEYVKQKYVQWPFAWADAMLDEEDKQ